MKASANLPHALAAVPQALLQGGLGLGLVPPSLAMDGASWRHLVAYLDDAGKLCSESGLQLPALCQATIEAAAANAALLAWVASLGQAAQRVAVRLEGASDESAARILDELGTMAASLRAPIGPLGAALRAAASSVIGAQGRGALFLSALSRRYRRNGEKIGALQARMHTLAARIAAAGPLRRQRRARLQAHQAALAAFLRKVVDQHQRQRQLLRLAEPLARHAVWLASAFDAVLAFLEKARAAFTTFGATCSQWRVDLPCWRSKGAAIATLAPVLTQASLPWHRLADAAAAQIRQASPPQTQLEGTPT